MKLQNGNLTVELAPQLGGAIASFRWRGVDLMRPLAAGSTDTFDASSFPLVPYANRVREGRFTFRGRTIQLSPSRGERHALHGDGWSAAWTVESQGADRATLSYRHEPGEWPWAYEARQEIVLDEHGLQLDLTMTNRSDTPMPAGLGQHPYFPADDETILSTVVENVFPVDAEVMPTGREPVSGRYDVSERRVHRADLDNGYDGWSGDATITWPNKSVALRMSSPGTRYFQVYAPPSGALFCAEPVTHANAALNAPEFEWAALGIRVLEPGEGLTLRARFDVAEL